MLEKPVISDELIAQHLLQNFGLQVTDVVFLPLGVDVNTAVYRVSTRESVPYFLKLRKGNFDPVSVLVPRHLFDQGICQIIQPFETKAGGLWSSMDIYTCILYPWIDGRSGFEVDLSDAQWIEFGRALRMIHDTVLPPELAGRIPVEKYSPYWREQVEGYLSQVQVRLYPDPTAEKMAAFMREHQDEIRWLVERAGNLAGVLLAQPQDSVLCHTDIHVGNLLLSGNGALYIVDWDAPLFAPKERDLMFPGAGIGSKMNTEQGEELFYQGYGPADINKTALAYYRCERIVQDIAEFGRQILSTLEGGEDREQGLRYFTSQFEPGDVIDIARRTVLTLEESGSSQEEY